MNENYVIAIDGPGGAGKSTIAKMVAKELNIDYIDTGAMYRAVAYKFSSEGIQLDKNEDVRKVLTNTIIDFTDGSILLDGKIIDDKIRTAEISNAASEVSKLPDVRHKLVDLQRRMGEAKSIIMDGRDIATNVFPNAKYKFYITATSEERAKRRFEELKKRGEDISFEVVLKDIENRDYNDRTRTLNPLKKAQDAIEIDTTNMTIEEVKKHIVLLVKE